MKITLIILIVISLCFLSIAYSFTTSKFSTLEKTFLTFQNALKKGNYRLAWQCIAEDSKNKKWHDFKTFKEHSKTHIFNENKIGLLEAKIVRCDVIGNVSGIIKNSNLARVELFREKRKWKIRDVVRVKEANHL